MTETVHEAYETRQYVDPAQDANGWRATSRIVAAHPNCFDAATVAEAQEVLSWESPPPAPTSGLWEACKGPDPLPICGGEPN